MNIDLLFDDYSEAYRKIFEIFKIILVIDHFHLEL